jgi:spectinomycin phosphotransferase
VIVEHPDIPAVRVGSVVRREWMLDINTVDHLDVGSTGWHWVLGDDDGPRWFATVDPVAGAAERHDRVEAFEAASELARRLPFTVAPVHTRDARIAVDLAPGLLLTVTPYLDGAPFSAGPLLDDVERGVVAGMLGELHRQPNHRRLPVWRPRLGWHADTRRTDLEDCLAQDVWAGGPWSGPASRIVLDSQPVIRQALKRYAMLGAAVVGNIDQWVVTHGEPSGRNLMHTLDGPRLVDWSTVALAPRERDLREVLGEADGDEPWYSYLEAGGRAAPLSPDTVELFALEWHLSVLSEQATRFSRPHPDTADERRHFGDLERELGTLVTRWA